MSVINGIRAYILENDLKITIVEDKIDIVNYVDIGHFDSNKIIVKSINKDIIISGNNLVVSKLMSYEILITGEFNSIEFRWYIEK